MYEITLYLRYDAIHIIFNIHAVLCREKYMVAKENHTSSFLRRLGVRICISVSEKKETFSLLKTFRIRAGKLN